MIYHGTVRDGVVVFLEDVHLPEGTPVVIQPLESPAVPAAPLTWEGTLRDGVPVFVPASSSVTPDL
jgi:hypothetical protein